MGGNQNVKRMFLEKPARARYRTVPLNRKCNIMPPLTGREAKKVLFYSLDCPFCLLPLLYFVWGHSAQIGALMHFLHQRAAHLVFLEWKFTPGGYSTFLISKYQGTGCRKMAHTLTSSLGPFHVGCSCSPHARVAFLWAPSQTRPFPSPKWRCPSADTHIFFILNPSAQCRMYRSSVYVSIHPALLRSPTRGSSRIRSEPDGQNIQRKWWRNRAEETNVAGSGQTERCINGQVEGEKEQGRKQSRPFRSGWREQRSLSPLHAAVGRGRN